MEDEKKLKNRDNDEEKLKANENDEKKLGDRNGEEDRKWSDVDDGTVMMVTLEARVMTETGDASSWKVNKLSQTHQVRTKTEHGWWGYDGAMTEWHKSIKIEMKIKERRWAKREY